MNAGETARLRNLCLLFRIPIEYTGDNPAAALSTVTYLYGMPAIADHGERRRYGNDILQSTSAFFVPSLGPRATAFFGRVQTLVIEMQEFPGWFSELSQSPEELVRTYWRWRYVRNALRFIGVGAIGGAFAAGFKEWAKNPTTTEGARTGMRTLATRLAGRGAVIEGLEILLAQGVPLYPALALGIVAAVALYYAAEEEMKKIEIVIKDKFQRGQLSKELYSQVFTEQDPDDIKEYWEMR
jgi:hypothetical protein